MFNIPKSEQRYTETELDLQRKLEYDKGYTDGRASIIEELEKIKAEIGLTVKTLNDGGYKRGFDIARLMTIEILDNHIAELKGE